MGVESAERNQQLMPVEPKKKQVEEAPSVDVAAIKEEVAALEKVSIHDKMTPPLYYRASTYRSRIAEKRSKYFEELTELVLASDPAFRGGRVPPPDYFPTLQVGFVCRAMGLQVSDTDVILIVKMVEEDEASQGCVSRSRLKAVIMEGLTTGIVGNPSLVEKGIIGAERLPAKPIVVIRSDEQTIFQAFQTLDTAGKGYLEEDELRAALTTMGEPMHEDEIDDMLLAVVDPDNGHIYYRDFADILAHE